MSRKDFGDKFDMLVTYFVLSSESYKFCSFDHKYRLPKNVTNIMALSPTWCFVTFVAHLVDLDEGKLTHEKNIFRLFFINYNILKYILY